LLGAHAPGRAGGNTVKNLAPLRQDTIAR